MSICCSHKYCCFQILSIFTAFKNELMFYYQQEKIKSNVHELKQEIVVYLENWVCQIFFTHCCIFSCCNTLFSYVFSQLLLQKMNYNFFCVNAVQLYLLNNTSSQWSQFYVYSNYEPTDLNTTVTSRGLQTNRAAFKRCRKYAMFLGCVPNLSYPSPFLLSFTAPLCL